ncbi:MAG TPA: hypothetical protein VFG91_09605 [Woeseiaceae bacterium]|nr:hypothetical protein [Woeseiaceae bacterium]
MLLALALPAAQAAEGWQYGGDIRGGYFALDHTARDGGETDSDEFKFRLRLSADRQLTDTLSFRARLAGIYSTEQDGSSVYLRGYPSRPGSGLAAGDATLDELYVHYAPADAGWTLRVGRMQTKFELPGVASKGLDRNDSPNVDVTWTDGLHLTQSTWLDGWTTHFILQHNHHKGASVTARSPLDFSDSGSRLSLFAGLEATKDLGAVIQRVIGFTYMPDALAPAGIVQAVREDYTALDAKLAAAWPVGNSGRKLVAGIEAAYAFNTPSGATVGTGEAGDTDGLAWQIAASIYDIRPGHHLGIVTGESGAGWLLSPDFRNNDRLHEIRYQWKFSSDWSMEARYRIREERRIPADAEGAREDRDIYIRLTGKF